MSRAFPSRPDRQRPWARRTGGPVAALVLAAAALAGCSNGSTTAPSADTSPTSSSASTGTTVAGTGATAGLTAVPGIVDKAQASVVTIITSKGLGSGVVYKADGTIVTDAHVVENARQVQVAFADGTRVTGKVVATDPVVDVAVVKVDRKVQPLPFADKLPQVGELAVVLGSPLGFENTVTAGIISGLHREIPGSAQQGQQSLVDLIQTDAPISPGNSGGAVLNGKGQVVGLSEAYIPPSAGAVALGFAIPSPTVVDVANQLIENGKAQHAYLGIRPTTVTPQLAQQLGVQPVPGAAVLSVQQGGPAGTAGVEPGDVITKLGDAKIGSAEDLLAALRDVKPGQQVPLVVDRDGKSKTLTVTVGDRPAS